MEDFKKALEGTLGRKHIDNIVDQVAGSPDRFDALYTLTQHEETKIAWHATWACEKLSILLPSLLMDKREELITGHAMPPRWNKTPATEYPSSSSCPEACQRSFLRFLPSRYAIFCRKRIRTSRLHETCLRHLPGRTGTDRRAESISGKYGTGILYGCSAMCPQQHPKKNKVMKILILNGSPRCQGLISRMLDIMAEEARIRGAEVEAISIHKLQVRPCTGCMACRSRQACVLPEDDAQRTLQKIQWADVLIVGSPCYWGNMNGHLKVVFDRIVYGMMGESPKGLPQALHKGKKAVIVSTCSTPWPFNIWFNQTRGVVKALSEILKWSGFSIKGVIQKGGTKQHPELTESDKKKCRKIIRNL